MAGNSYGTLFRITTFGESHGEALGGIIDGCPSGIKLDLGFRNNNSVDAFKLAGVYQWVWNIDGGFNWYAGVGGGIGSWNDNNLDNNGTFVFGAGDIGIEYGFEEVPILLSLDFRPEIGAVNYYGNNYSSDIALGVRFKF